MEVMKNKLIMIKEQSFNYDVALSTSKETTVFIRNIMKLQEEPEETLILISLNSKNRIIGFCEISRGTINLTCTSGREVFKRALLMNATKIIIAHNHPSGDPTPSKADLKITEQMKEISNLLDIQFLDHLIIGDDEDYTIMGAKTI